MKRIQKVLRRPVITRIFGARFISIMLSLNSAARSQDAVVLDFPQKKHSDTPPAGLADWPKEDSKGLVTITIPLLSLKEDGCLLATVMFQDDEGRILLAKWIGTDAQPTILAANLSNGIRGWNQRTIKVPGALLQTDGSLVLETDAETQPVRRVSIAWTWPAGVYMSVGAQAVSHVQGQDLLFTERDLSEANSGPLPDTWSAGIWRAFLQEKVETLDQTLAFSVPFDTAPKAVIFRARLLGFSMEAAPVVWVNGTRAGPIALEVPGLAHPGYFKTEDGLINFAGWRKGGIMVPPEYFKVGDNLIVLSARKGCYINDALLDLSFEDEGAPIVVEQATMFTNERDSSLSPIPHSLRKPVTTETNPVEPSVIVSPPTFETSGS